MVGLPNVVETRRRFENILCSKVLRGKLATETYAMLQTDCGLIYMNWAIFFLLVTASSWWWFWCNLGKDFVAKGQNTDSRTRFRSTIPSWWPSTWQRQVSNLSLALATVQTMLPLTVGRLPPSWRRWKRLWHGSWKPSLLRSSISVFTKRPECHNRRIEVRRSCFKVNHRFALLSN